MTATTPQVLKYWTLDQSDAYNIGVAAESRAGDLVQVGLSGGANAGDSPACYGFKIYAFSP